MDHEQAFPVIRQTVPDTTDPRRLAEFYRQTFGLRYRPGNEPPGPGQPDQKGQDWLILVPDDIRQRIQSCTDLARLEAWGDRAVTANSLDEIFTA